MRKKGDNLIYWEWDTVKDASGNTLEIKFLKKAVNINQQQGQTEKVVNGSYWSGQTGWQSLENEIDGQYRQIPARTPQFQGFVTLCNYANAHPKWVNRYSIN